MCRVGKKPETRARARAFSLPELDPSPSFNTRPIPETRPATRGYPRVTRIGKSAEFSAILGQNSKYFGYFSLIFRNFWLFTSKFSTFLAIFCQIFEIFGCFPPKYCNFCLFSAKILKLLSKFTQPTTRRVPGYPTLITRAGTTATRARPEPDH